MSRVEGKVALITGGGGRLGSATAQILAREGADIAIWELAKSMDAAEKMAKEIRDIGRRALVMEVDVTDNSRVNDAAQEVISELGKIDILVNNAGKSKVAPLITDLSYEDWAWEIGLNLTGVFHCTRAVLKHMIDRHSGKIINISSFSAEHGRLFTSAGYVSAKAGVLGFTMSVARSVAKYGICVNAITPGIILGPGHHKIFTEEQLQVMLQGIPLAESSRSGRPEDIAYAVLFLASSESDYITGTRIRVNGGSLMG